MIHVAGHVDSLYVRRSQIEGLRNSVKSEPYPLLRVSTLEIGQILAVPVPVIYILETCTLR